MKQRLPRRLLERPPQFESAAQQRNVERMFEIREADDSGQSVGGAAVMTDGEALEHEHALTAAGQVTGHRGAHAAGTGDDDVGNHCARCSRISVPKAAPLPSSSCLK